jgi:hypothetical protein
MKRIFVILIIVSSGIYSIAEGQARGKDTSLILEKLFSRLVTSTEDTDRLRINDSIKFIIGSYAGSDTVFTHKFANLRFLGQVTSKNSQLKIISWNLLLKDSESRYYCYFIHNSGKKNQVHMLEGKYKEDQVRNDTVYSEKDWYGALYYDLRLYKKESQPYWILLGIDLGNPSITRKIIDVLTFSPTGEIVFGKKLFTSGEITKYREVIEYSSEAVISLKFRTYKSITFDHVVPVSPASNGKREFYGPDFSYDAYNLEKGIWKFKSDIDARNKKK